MRDLLRRYYFSVPGCPEIKLPSKQRAPARNARPARGLDAHHFLLFPRYLNFTTEG